MSGHASLDSSYLFGVTPTKYFRHLAEVAPVGRSGAATLAAAFPWFLAAAAASEWEGWCDEWAR